MPARRISPVSAPRAWARLREHYDDGGFSGGTLDRPTLKQLIADIDDGPVDVVVVYKIDRLGRTLMGFSKPVEIFDRHGVTFVSVTQSFNTTPLMGRLTLNILPSFARFEREVIGEQPRQGCRLEEEGHVDGPLCAPRLRLRRGRPQADRQRSRGRVGAPDFRAVH